MLQAATSFPNEHAVARERPLDAIDPVFRLEWQGLAGSFSEPNAFGEDWFLLPALKALALGEVRLVEVRVLSGELIGLIPLCRHDRYGRVPVRHVRNWIHYQCFMGAPLIRAGQETAFWSALLGWLDDMKWASGFLSLCELLEDGPIHQGLIATASRLGRPCATVYRYERAALESELDRDTYLATHVRGKKRKELRRLANRLAELGEVTFSVLSDAADLPGWTDEFLALESAGWKGERGAALNNTEETRGFLQAVLTGAMERGRLDFQRLTLDGRAIAMLINFRTPPGSWSFKIAYDESLARFSPGVMIELENLTRVLSDPEIDWMDSCAVPGHPMIDRLWAERRPIVQVTVPLAGARRRTLHGIARAAETASARLKALAA